MKATEQLQLAGLAARIRAEERERARHSLHAFGQLYLAHYLDKPGSSMHRELYPLLEQLRPGARVAVAAPRGSAKSTLISVLYVLWSICHKRHRYIVLISDTADKAAEFLHNVKHELVHNPRLMEDYPEVCEQGGNFPAPPRWRRNEIITLNGVKVTALGVHQNIRGRRHVEARPDLILLDDVENRDNTYTAEARGKLLEWLNKAVLKAGTKDTQVLVVGTILHYDSLLARLTDRVKSPTWVSRIYRSIRRWSPRTDLWERWTCILRRREEFEEQDGPDAAQKFFEANRAAMLDETAVLWPESEDYYTLMLMREAEGPASFDSEKQNEPVNPEDCFFLEDDFVYWDDRFATEAALLSAFGKPPKFYGACDPSLGRQGKHADDSAIMTLVRDGDNGTLYLLDADIARRKPDRIIDDILAYGRIRKFDSFAIEANQFQAFLADELKRRAAIASLHFSVEAITHTTDKVGRIQSLQPLLRSGTLQLSRRQRTLIEQLRLFPKAAHDDGPDALEMAVAASRKPAYRFNIKDFILIPRPTYSGFF